MCMFFVAAVAVWNCTHLSDFIPQILKAKLHHGHAFRSSESDTLDVGTSSPTTLQFHLCATNSQESTVGKPEGRCSAHVPL